MRRIRSGCCARAVSGHAIAVPPRRGRSAASVLKTCGPAGSPSVADLNAASVLV